MTLSQYFNEYRDEVFAGRQELLTDLLPADIAVNVPGSRAITPENLQEDLTVQYPAFLRNANQSRYLINYFKGVQPIVVRQVEERAIDNKTVVNFAYAISRNLSSYAYSTGIQYVATSTEYSDDVKTINDLMVLAGKQSVTQDMKYLQSICGRTFISIENNKTDPDSGCPFVIKSLSPVDTFTVNSVFDRNTCVYAGYRYSINNGTDTTEYLQVFDTYNCYTFTNSGSEFVMESVVPHLYGSVPIMEVKNNTFMLGDFEMAISLLDAINAFSSDWTTNVEEIVTSYLCLFGIDPDFLTEETMESMKKNRILAFPNANGVNQSANFIYAQLDGTSMDMLKSYLNESLKLITGMPDRDSSNANTSGVAEDIKTGQNDRESIAIEKSSFAEVAEKKLLRILLKMLKGTYLTSDIKVSDIDVDITRINRDNILTKSQSLLNMKEFGMDAADAVYFANLTNDVEGVAARVQANWDKLEEKANESTQPERQNPDGSDFGDRTDYTDRGNSAS